MWFDGVDAIDEAGGADAPCQHLVDAVSHLVDSGVESLAVAGTLGCDRANGRVGGVDVGLATEPVLERRPPQVLAEQARATGDMQHEAVGSGGRCRAAALGSGQELETTGRVAVEQWPVPGPAVEQHRHEAGRALRAHRAVAVCRVCRAQCGIVGVWPPASGTPSSSSAAARHCLPVSLLAPRTQLATQAETPGVVPVIQSSGR